MASVLIIDDDPGISYTLSRMVEGMGHQASQASTLADGMELALSQPFDVVFLDVRLPDGSGLEALPAIKAAPSAPEVIILTAYGEPQGAELAIKSGAWSYIQKPSSIREMALPLLRAIQYREETRKGKPPLSLKREGIIGESAAFRACLDLVAQAAATDVNVLISGETGTGKELLARAIHENSSRADGAFVVVDCAALPETLVESLLFGHEKGAFTGADRARDGLIKQADHGTLFLDEVGELPPNVQKSFLRVLQERRFRSLGGGRELQSDFRLVAATNRNLDQMVADEEFREDLLYRLRSQTIPLPPLRNRQEDIKDLTLYHLSRLCERHGVGTKGLSPDFWEALSAYQWPGNVRELVSALDRALAVAREAPTLFAAHLPTNVRINAVRASLSSPDGPGPFPGAGPEQPRPLPRLKEARQAIIDEFEREYLKDLMALSKGKISQACRLAGVTRQRLYVLLKKYDLLHPT